MDKFKQSQPQHYRMKKQALKVNKQPMKIVYIGNPMMFKANNCWEFRQIVQELTGQQRTENKNSMYSAPDMNKRPQANTRINVMDRMVDEDLLRPISSTQSVYEEQSTTYSSNDELWYNNSSSTEHPSSSVEDKLHHSSSTEFVNDFFSVDMLNRLDEFQYPFSNV